MNNAEMKIENDKLVILLSGHIDSSNAPEVEKTVNGFREENPQLHMVIDAEKLEYISSAGLRVILRLRKADSEVKVINVSPEVYEIFDMTGFTEMMKIEKAYRVFSVDGCEVIGTGSNGDVYRVDRDTIVKVYKNADSLAEIQRERELARRALIMGIPTAIPYDVVRVGNTYGSVFELLNARSFAKILKDEPEKLDELIEMYADLLKKIHETEDDSNELPHMKEVAIKWAKDLQPHLEENTWNKLSSLIEAVPESEHMLHGDYHFKNIMMMDGEIILIDMDTLAKGNPVFEFASMWLAYKGFSSLDHTVVEKFLGVSYDHADRIWNETLRLYMGTDEEPVLEKQKIKAEIMGLTRMLRRTIRREPDQTELINFSKERLSQLLEAADTLVW